MGLINTVEIDRMASLSPELAEQRLTEIKAQYGDRKLYLAGHQLLFGLVRKMPKLADKVLGVKIPDDIEVIANRPVNTVFYADGAVLKINRYSQGSSDAMRQESVRARQDIAARFQGLFGDVIIPSIIGIEPHPFNDRRPVVTARQEFLDGVDWLDFNRFNPPEAYVTELERFGSNYPSLSRDLEELFERAVSLPADEGIFDPGQHNIGVHKGTLVDVDPYLDPHYQTGSEAEVMQSTHDIYSAMRKL